MVWRGLFEIMGCVSMMVVCMPRVLWERFGIWMCRCVYLWGGFFGRVVGVGLFGL